MHEGYYSVNDECFYMEKDLSLIETTKGHKEYFTQMGEKVNWVSEENYLFNFNSEIKEKVGDWITSEGSPVQPKYIRAQVLNDLKNSKDHISISRPKRRINWGIEVPKSEDG